ncbi:MULTISPECIES: tryptophan synthase subunit alpha [Glutamicibacter]|uniref:Tryptophan synthase alpha chain n=2 Tax=Glutamicibacter arilaitensis TaxID=256701 RepID=A0A2N7S3I1_9MICC|nr:MULTISPECIES: tryptophan synthase subunit alpha [Glutamicibacter]PMQ20674.1 tryptophan synthase subunit alpha [Glutamicibacter arilaitensis]CBT76164.1 tryptophan synthase alpha chain [Glutamicibacter arilaitensis Re117]HCH47443.1 tryptophan synthase subunit alpha [Glutamicibacter sp.]
MTRVTSAEKIAAARAEGRPALIGYLPAGFPDVQTSIDAAVALAENGVDVIEIGIPYSDPVMDGAVIQEATVQALANGFKVPQIFEIVRGITERTNAAVMVMTYWNPVLRLGVDEFSRRFAEAGGAGLITPDLVPDEADEWLAASEKYGLERVFLIAPSSTEDRVQRTVDASSGFVYCVSLMGVTGARTEVSSAAQAVVDAAHNAGAENACVGLGVSRREHVEEIGAYADGVIVGTALVAALRDGGVKAVGALAAELSGRA